MIWCCLHSEHDWWRKELSSDFFFSRCLYLFYKPCPADDSSLQRCLVLIKTIIDMSATLQHVIMDGEWFKCLVRGRCSNTKRRCTAFISSGSLYKVACFVYIFSKLSFRQKVTLNALSLDQKYHLQRLHGILIQRIPFQWVFQIMNKICFYQINSLSSLIHPQLWGEEGTGDSCLPEFEPQ